MFAISLALWATLAAADEEAEAFGPSLWLPAGEHAGQQHPSGLLEMFEVPMWTQDDVNAASVLVHTDEVSLGAGSWRALVELWGVAPADADLLTVQVFGGESVVEQTLNARRFGDHRWSGLQAQVVSFELSAPARVHLQLRSVPGVRVHVGAVQIAPDRPRPFYVIQHCVNSLGRLQNARGSRAACDSGERPGSGANAIEVDVQWTGDDLLVAHPFGSPPACGLARAEGADLKRMWAEIAAWMAEPGGLAMLMLDIKRPAVDRRAYARALAMALTQAGIAADRVVLSVPYCDAQRFQEEMKNAGFEAHLDAWHEPFDGGTTAQHVDDAVAAGADFLGIGADPVVVHRPIATWLEPLKALVDRRDRDPRLKAVFFWTVEREVSMRVALDAGVDGLIINRPARLLEVLRRPPYDRLFRLATKEDPIGAPW